MMHEDVDVLVIGGGPSGLSAATELKQMGVKRVLVIDREPELGGIPRYCHHTGFGLFDFKSILSGPAYAKKRRELAERAKVELQVGTTILGWEGPLILKATSPRGLYRISSRAVLLATGCREIPRSARLIPGTRPKGIFTTGSLQQLVYSKKVSVGKRGVVIGAEHVSFSALHTLVSSKTEVAAMVTEHPGHQSYNLLRWLTFMRSNTPIISCSRVTNIFGYPRVEGIEVTEIQTGKKTTFSCDTVVFTGGFIPDHEVARMGGVILDPGTKGPQVDNQFRTSVRGVFASGNILRGAERADVASLEGKRAAISISEYLIKGDWPKESQRTVINLTEPLLWILPNVVTNENKSRFLMRVSEFVYKKTLIAAQKNESLFQQYFRQLIPNRTSYLTGEWCSRINCSEKSVKLCFE